MLDILRNTQPKFPYHSLSLKKDLMLESWVVRRPTSFQQGWGEFIGAIGDCCVMNMDYVIGSKES